MTVRLYHQLDKHNGKIVGDHWILDGIGYHEGLKLKSVGFNWIPGHKSKGAWEAPNQDAVQPLINLGIDIINTGNGHKKG